MAFANSSVTDVIATTIESRSGELADNVTKNNAVVLRLSQKGNIRPFSGGSQIFEEIMFAENGNVGWYSGYDLLSVAAQDVISAAAFSIKQLACPVAISGLEMIQNSGDAQIIDLLEGRIKVAEATMMNNLANGIYSDGTGSGGKILTGLAAAVASSPSTGTYGGIDRATFTFWRNQTGTGIDSASAAQGAMNTIWASMVRGKDHPDLILMDNVLWGRYVNSLQVNQRFMDPKLAEAGFSTVKFMTADVVLDGGIGGFAPSKTSYWLNTDYIFLRPHRDRNMVPLNPNRRVSVNQDAEVQIIAWAGNLTCSGAQFQGYATGT